MGQVIHLNRVRVLDRRKTEEAVLGAMPAFLREHLPLVRQGIGSFDVLRHRVYVFDGYRRRHAVGLVPLRFFRNPIRQDMPPEAAVEFDLNGEEIVGLEMECSNMSRTDFADLLSSMTVTTLLTRDAQ